MGEFIEKNYAIIAHPLMISAKLSLCPSVTTCPSVTNDIPIKLKNYQRIRFIIHKICARPHSKASNAESKKSHVVDPTTHSNTCPIIYLICKVVCL